MGFLFPFLYQRQCRNQQQLSVCKATTVAGKRVQRCCQSWIVCMRSTRASRARCTVSTDCRGVALVGSDTSAEDDPSFSWIFPGWSRVSRCAHAGTIWSGHRECTSQSLAYSALFLAGSGLVELGLGRITGCHALPDYILASSATKSDHCPGRGRARRSVGELS